MTTSFQPRLPEARQPRPSGSSAASTLRAALPRPSAASTLRAAQEAAKQAVEHGEGAQTTELLMTRHMRPPNAQLRSVNPLSTRPVLHTAALDKGWPTKTSALCLHCTEPIVHTPLPVARYYDAHAEVYWVQGFFCRPCCALAFVRDEVAVEQQRVLAWTREVLAKQFHVQEPLTAAPPRLALAKFGGPMDLSEFYGEDAERTQFVAAMSSPLVSFSMYLEVVKNATAGAAGGGGGGVDTTKAAAEGSQGGVVGARGEVTRPTIRTAPLATPQPTGKAPLLLEYLASMHLESLLADETAQPLGGTHGNHFLEPRAAAHDVAMDEGSQAADTHDARVAHATLTQPLLAVQEPPPAPAKAAPKPRRASTTEPKQRQLAPADAVTASIADTAHGKAMQATAAKATTTAKKGTTSKASKGGSEPSGNLQRFLMGGK